MLFLYHNCWEVRYVVRSTQSPIRSIIFAALRRLMCRLTDSNISHICTAVLIIWADDVHSFETGLSWASASHQYKEANKCGKFNCSVNT